MGKSFFFLGMIFFSCSLLANYRIDIKKEGMEYVVTSSYACKSNPTPQDSTIEGEALLLVYNKHNRIVAIRNIKLLPATSLDVAPTRAFIIIPRDTRFEKMVVVDTPTDIVGVDVFDAIERINNNSIGISLISTILPSQFDSNVCYYGSGGITPILVYGDASDTAAINIAFVSEGYDENDLDDGLFEDDVNELVDYLFSIDPYKKNKTFFRVYRYEIPSNVSGVGDGTTRYGMKQEDFDDERSSGYRLYCNREQAIIDMENFLLGA